MAETFGKAAEIGDFDAGQIAEAARVPKRVEDDSIGCAAHLPGDVADVRGEAQRLIRNSRIGPRWRCASPAISIGLPSSKRGGSSDAVSGLPICIFLVDARTAALRLIILVPCTPARALRRRTSSSEEMLS